MSQKAKRVHWIALGRNILVVAKEGGCDDWAAYIGVVAGVNYEREWRDVAAFGDKLRKDVAELLFAQFKDLTWRY